MSYLPSLPEGAVLPDVLSAFPDSGKPMVEYAHAVMRGPSAFSEGERELLAAYVSALNSCRFCVGVHRAAARTLGVDPAVLDQLLDDPDTAPIDDALRPVVRYVRKLTLTPTRITPADPSAILDAGWTERAVHDAASICGLFNLFNRFVDGLGIDADREFFSAAAAMLSAPNGYRAQV